MKIKVRELFKKIHFCQMTTEDYITVKARSGDPIQWNKITDNTELVKGDILTVAKALKNSCNNFVVELQLQESGEFLEIDRGVIRN